MKKIFIILSLLTLISSIAFAEITEKEGREYIDKNVQIVIDCYISPYYVSGKVLDIIFINDEYQLMLKTNYYDQKIWFINLKDIGYIKLQSELY